MADPFIIMCAPNGARRSKADHANIPLTPAELADCAEEILNAGASILHLHVRDDNGEHTLSVDKYREAIAAIRARVGDKLVIQATSEAVGIYSRQQQIDMVKALKPEAVSLALREICPNAESETDTTEFFSWMKAEHIAPQIILYNEADTLRFDCLRRAGVFCDQYPFVLCVLGKYDEPLSIEPLSDEAAARVAKKLGPFVDVLNPAGVPWAVCGFGKTEHLLAEVAAKLGGHVRVGFENNLHGRAGGLVEDNAELVRGSCKSVMHAGHSIASAQDVRKWSK